MKDQAAEDEAWALFDRVQHTRIPQAVAEAATAGVEVCFSHPSFDLWLLLHFQAFGGRQSGSSDVVKDKLRKADPAFRNFDKRGDKSVKGPRAEGLERSPHHVEGAARDHCCAGCLATPLRRCRKANRQAAIGAAGGERGTAGWSPTACLRNLNHPEWSRFSPSRHVSAPAQPSG